MCSICYPVCNQGMSQVALDLFESYFSFGHKTVWISFIYHLHYSRTVFSCFALSKRCHILSDNRGLSQILPSDWKSMLIYIKIWRNSISKEIMDLYLFYFVCNDKTFTKEWIWKRLICTWMLLDLTLSFTFYLNSFTPSDNPLYAAFI
jgi:hypothetical protein